MVTKGSCMNVASCFLLDGIDYDEGWYITSQYNSNI